MKWASRGVNLVEVVVALAILSILMGAVFNLIPSSRLASHRGETLLTASNIAQAVLEERRALPFDNLEVNETYPLETQTHNGVSYRPVLTVSAVGTYAPRYIKLLTVTVTWEERGVQRELVQELRLFRQNG